MAETQFEINKIYIKDFSSEVPSAPEIFKAEWEPEIDLNFGNGAALIEEEHHIYEVSLTITVTAKLGEHTAYIIEVEQAGIFTIDGFDDEQRGFIIGAATPNILFPYAREAISTMSQKAGFPPMLLNPIDFTALYYQHLQNQAENQQAETEEDQTKH
ncbi:MAG: protein-export chaperone SecB [Gammaproteobacteria bacterium]|nr:MAG: protein-export chaperone SecB [Gammaproteobacteria bacterium]